LAATFEVDTTSDLSVIACTEAAADCSLRGAIAAANVAADLDLIEFNIRPTIRAVMPMASVELLWVQACRSVAA